MEKNTDGAAGYTARLANPSLNDSNNPREVAEAEEISNRTREATGPGRWRAMEERLDAQHARMIDEQAAWREERARMLKEHKDRLDQEFEETRRRSDFALAQIREMFNVGNAAVVAAYENVERARTAAEILTREPPPRSTSAENWADFGKHVVGVLGQLAGKVIENDPAAQQRLQELTHQVLNVPSALGGESAVVEAPAAPSDNSANQAPATAPPSAPPAPAPGAPVQKLVVADLLAIAKLVPEERVQEVAAQLGVEPVDVPLEMLLPMAREAAKEAAKAQAVSERA